MNTRNTIFLLILGATILYCAKMMIQESIDATTDCMDAYYSILGWAMYFIGWVMFIGSLIATGINLLTKEK